MKIGVRKVEQTRATTQCVANCICNPGLCC
jgi:hypothetical protein